MKYVKLVNSRKKEIGIRLYYKFNNELYYSQIITHSPIKDSQLSKFKRDLYKNKIKHVKELEEKRKEKMIKKDLKKLLDLITPEEYLNVIELRDFLNSCQIPLLYMYDMLGVGSLHTTSKGIKLIDSLNISHYLYKDDYKFYKENFII